MGIIDGIITTGDSDTAGQNEFSGQNGNFSANLFDMAKSMSGITTQPVNKPWVETKIVPQPVNKPRHEGMKPLYMQKLETEGDPVAGVAEYKQLKLKERGQEAVFSGIPGFQACQLASKGNVAGQAQSDGATMGQGTQAQTGSSGSQQPGATGSGAFQPETGEQNGPGQFPAPPTAASPPQRRNKPYMPGGDRDTDGGGTSSISNPGKRPGRPLNEVEREVLKRAVGSFAHTLATFAPGRKRRPSSLHSIKYLSDNFGAAYHIDRHRQPLLPLHNSP
jgi:hypothetical protein